MILVTFSEAFVTIAMVVVISVLGTIYIQRRFSGR
jgi:hypothetical protein